jgi:uncharacterized protein (DUF1330 family)
MTAYLISICRSVSDRERLEDYWAHAAPTFQGFDARPLATYPPFEVLEGNAGAKGIVLFQFPSMEVARRWYLSDAYQEVMQRRFGAAEFELILFDGALTPAGERMPEVR